MKVCSKCKAEKPKEDFSRNMSNKDGRKSTCKKCEQARKKVVEEERKFYRQFEVL